MSVKYLNKYLKYKKKYNDLKGGYGWTLKYWNDHESFGRTNDDNIKNIIISTEYNKSKEQFHDYKKMLDQLLVHSNGLINLDFINLFHRKIYYDLTKKFSIVLNKLKDRDTGRPTDTIDIEKVIDKPEFNNYKLSNVYTQTHGNTTILFLENKKDETDKKVLKIFNNINIDINAIKDYLSLEITRINNNPVLIGEKFQKNYNHISYDDFQTFNFNMQNHFIKTQNHIQDNIDYLYLSCKNNDAINDYIINIIIQKIDDNDDCEKINFVKYHNLFVTEVIVDGVSNWRYCIIMDHFDGTLKNYISKIIARLNPGQKQKLLNYICEETEKQLDKIKDPRYLFTHTDMKTENIFYRKNDEDELKPYIYIADFDKSSISFKNIRFYNDITQSSNQLNRFINTDGILGTLFKTDTYSTNNSIKRSINFYYKNDHKYRLSKNFINITEAISDTLLIEFNQLYMRYNNTPYYISFDMVSLILSLFNTKIISQYEKNTIIEKYIHKNSVNNLFTTYHDLADDMNGDFGLLLKPLFYNFQSIRNTFIFIQSYNKIKYDHLAIEYLYLSTKNNKIGLSLPYKPITVKAFSSGPTTFYRIDHNDTEIQDKIKLKSNNQFYIKFKDNIKDNNIIIDYNIDWDSTAATSFNRPKFIIKTNRYSSIIKLASRIFEYEEFIIDKDNYNLNNIYNLYNKINESDISFDNKLDKNFDIIHDIRKLLELKLNDESICFFTNLYEDLDIDHTITTKDDTFEEITIKEKPKSIKKINLLELDRFLDEFI